MNATQKQWRAKEERALRSPVARAIAKREIQELHRQVQEVALVCLAVEHGTEQRELLASLAFMIGIGAEVAAVASVQGDNRAGLHQSLAEVLRMACDGGRWDESWAAQLHIALEVSAELMMDNTHHAALVLPGARELAADVRAGRIRPDAIVPFEMPEHYQMDSCKHLQAVA